LGIHGESVDGSLYQRLSNHSSNVCPALASGRRATWIPVLTRWLIRERRCVLPWGPVPQPFGWGGTPVPSHSSSFVCNGGGGRSGEPAQQTYAREGQCAMMIQVHRAFRIRSGTSKWRSPSRARLLERRNFCPISCRLCERGLPWPLRVTGN